MYIYHIESSNRIYIGQASEDVPTPLVKTQSFASLKGSRLWKHFTNLITGAEPNDGAREIFKHAPLSEIEVTIYPANTYYGLSKDAFKSFLNTFIPSQLTGHKTYAQDIIDAINDATKIRKEIYQELENGATSISENQANRYNNVEQEIVKKFSDRVINNISSSYEGLDIAEILHILYYAKTGKKQLMNRQIGGQYVLEWKVVGDPTATRALTRWRTSPRDALQIIATLERPQGRSIINLNRVVRTIFREVMQDPELISDMFKLDSISMKGDRIYLGLNKEDKIKIVQKMKEKFTKIVEERYTGKEYNVLFSKDALPQINDTLFTVSSLDSFLQKSRNGLAKNFQNTSSLANDLTKLIQEALIKNWKKENFFHWNFSNFLKIVPKTNVKKETGASYLQHYQLGLGGNVTDQVKIYAIILFAHFYKSVEKISNPTYYSDSLILESSLVAGGSSTIALIKLTYPNTIQQQVRKLYRNTALCASSPFLNSGWNLFYHQMLRLMPKTAWDRGQETVLKDTYNKELQQKFSTSNTTYVVQNYAVDGVAVKSKGRPRKERPDKLYPYYKIPTATWNTYRSDVSINQLQDY